MRGRKPKSTHLHRLQGTQPSASRSSEPRTTGSVGEPPEHLSAPAAILWRYYRDTAPPGVLASVDAAVFESFILACDMVRRAAEAIERDGAVMETEHGPAENPACRLLARFSAQLVKSASECGFSPASRPRIHVEPPAAPNPFAAFGAARRERAAS